MPTNNRRANNPLLYEKTRLVLDAVLDLKLEMERLGVSQAQLAEKLGKTRGIMSRQLAGRENLSLGKLAEMAFALGRRFDLKLSPIEAAVTRVTSDCQIVNWAPRDARERLTIANESPRTEQGESNIAA